MSAVGNFFKNVFTGGSSSLMNGPALGAVMGDSAAAEGIMMEEGANAVAGMQRNLFLNQMRRFNDEQKTLGQIG